MQVVYEKLWFSKNIWSISAGSSRVITIWTTILVYRTWADDWIGTMNTIHWWMAWPRISELLFVMQTNEATLKTNCPKKHFWPPNWWPLRYHHQKRRKHVRMTDLLSCKLSHQLMSPSPRYLSPVTYRETKRHTNTAHVVSDKMHTSVTFAG